MTTGVPEEDVVRWRRLLRPDIPSESMLDLIARLIAECERAKQELRAAGYGVTGTGILRTVREALDDR
jgi:predicted NBD/HSP70 family sugar kinase